MSSGNRKYWVGKLSRKIYVIFMLILLVPLSIQSGVFLYISIYRGHYALPCHGFEANIQEEKTIFKMAKNIIRSNIFTGK